MVSSQNVPMYYSNGMRLTAKSTEFTLDFWLTEPEADKPKTICRVILSPYIFKKFTKLAQDHLSIYEKEIGQIPVEGPKMLQMGFVGEEKKK